MRNYYKVLGVSEKASPDEIKRAYRKLVVQFHPDRNPHDANAVEMMKMFNEAHEVLSDPAKRQRYDYELGTRSSTRIGASKEDAKSDAGVKQYQKGSQTIWVFSFASQYSISPFVVKLLKIDFVVSLVLLIYCLFSHGALPKMPAEVYEPIRGPYGGFGGTWMTRLLGSGIMSFALSVWAMYKLSQTMKSHFLVRFVYLKCALVVLLVTGVIGLLFYNMNATLPSLILAWNVVTIVCLFIYRLDQEVGGTR